MQTLVLAASLVGVAAAGVAADPSARYDFKPHFAIPLRYPLDSSAAKLGYVQVEKQDFRTQSPALKLDCTGCKDRVVVMNFNIPPARLAAFRGKRIEFSAQVKWLAGEGELAATMRAFGPEGLVVTGQMIAFRGVKGTWQPLVAHWMVPREDRVQRVDVHVGLINSPQPPVVLLDDVVLREEQAVVPSVQPNFASALPKDDRPLVLVSDGKPAATIVTAKDPTRTVKFAVAELNDHLQACTGARLPVVTDDQPITGATIHVGQTQLTARLGLSPALLAPDSWLVWRTGASLVLSGGDNAENLNPDDKTLAAFGTLYATYEFLERSLGVRWYWPGELGRVAPQRKDLAVDGVRWQGQPSYPTRFFWYSNPNDKDFSARDVIRWWRRLRWGSVAGDPIGMHSFNDWPQRFGHSHPEYFALQRDGRRATDDEHGYVCLSNPDVLRQVIADKRAAFAQRAWSHYQPVMPGDSFGLGYCQCADCQAAARPSRGAQGKYSEAVWTFVNRVAAETRTTHPDRFISCCAYSEYAQVPELHLEPNVAVTLCAGRYFPILMWKAESKAAYVDWIGQWSQKAANLYMWDYWLPRHHKGVHGAPAIFPHAIQEWFLLDRGRIKGRAIELENIDAQGKDSRWWEDWMFDALNVYVGTRLMWNVDQNVDQLLDEFYAEFYGPAGPLVRQFYETLETAYAAPATKGAPDVRWDWSTCWVDTYPPSLVERVMGYLRKAEQTTRSQEPYHARVEKTLRGFLPFEAASRQFAASAAGR
jgi:hypothetical protein